jgi:2-phosphoglycerate kinase
MAKTVVISPDQEGSTPFLRGILTRSLQNAGLPFEQAYELASAIRDELSDRSEISTEELREVVSQHLEEHGEEVVDRYQTSSRAPATIVVHQDGDADTPFSRAQLRRHLEACGLAVEPAAETTSRIFEHLVRSGVTEISSGELGLLTYEDLEREFGSDIARRHLVWTHFTHSDRPLLLFIGGAPGSGKSTIATEVAHRLEIVRTQSTDMLREVMRMMVPERLLPSLHTSSFTAWEALPTRQRETADPEELLEDGYRSQAWLLSVACEAVLRRSLTERVSLILEGVHVQPSLVEMIPEDSDAVVVPIVLAVLSRKTLRKRLLGRGRVVAARRAERYLDHFDEIWQLQSQLLSEADRHGVPIIPNTSKEDVVQHVITIIINALDRDFTATLAEVFEQTAAPDES